MSVILSIHFMSWTNKGSDVVHTDRRSSVGRLEGRIEKRSILISQVEEGCLIDCERSQTTASLRWDNSSGCLRGEIYHHCTGNRDYIQSRWAQREWYGERERESGARKGRKRGRYLLIWWSILYDHTEGYITVVPQHNRPAHVTTSHSVCAQAWETRLGAGAGSVGWWLIKIHARYGFILENTAGHPGNTMFCVLCCVSTHKNKKYR